MTYDPKQHHRRSIRAKRYDYATCGAYFITICIHEQQSVLGEIRNGIVGLSGTGCMVRKVWDELPTRYHGVETDAIVVMPNHMHGIIVLTGGGQARGPAPTAMTSAHVGVHPRVRPQSAAAQAWGPAPTVPMVVQRFKSFTTHLHGRKLWQRNYFEHIVRGDRDLDRIRDYVHTNPIRWSVDHENPNHDGEDEFERWLQQFNAPVGTGSYGSPSPRSS